MCLAADDGQAAAEVLQNWAWPNKLCGCDDDDNDDDDLVAVVCDCESGVGAGDPNSPLVRPFKANHLSKHIYVSLFDFEW